MSLRTLSIGLALLVVTASPRAEVIFETYSAYHHIMVVDEGGIRTLSFNGSYETQMSLTNPLTGHFEYTEYFHMPWVWNPQIKRVLMMGLGGGSTQRSYQHYHTNTYVDTVEIDPAVTNAAYKYFGVVESPTHKINVSDGRVFLQRSTQKYDVILMDAYATTRYGSSLPPHLVTKEFFELARGHLGTNGVLAYNVIGRIGGTEADIVGAIYRTLKEVFPQVYLFPANTSYNVVLVATQSPQQYDYTHFYDAGLAVTNSGTAMPPDFKQRLRSFRALPPPEAEASPVLTDDRAPVDMLMRDIR
jgi:spermidine synthase